MENILSNLIIEKLCAVTRMYNDSGSGSKRIKRERWGLVFKYEGETVYISEGERIVSNFENLVLLPCGSSYEWKCTKAGNYVCVEFECSLDYRKITSFRVSNSEEISNLLKQIEYKWLKKKGIYKIESIRDVYTLLLKLDAMQNEQYVPSGKLQRLAPAYDFILTHYKEDMTNDSLALLCGISTVYFRKLFKDAYGTSPIDFVKLLRIKKAKEMLRGDYGSISDIAISLGYPSIYDFSRDFKKRVGVSPSKY